jgi:hypothetical protein
VVDTREKPKEHPSEWYSNVDMKQKFTRGDVETLKYIKRVIKECIDASKNGGDLKRWIMELRTKIHEVEFLLVLKDIIIKKSGLLESNGLSLIFDGEDKAVFPWDIAADAEALWMRWMSGDIDPHLLRGIKTEKGVLASGKKSTTHRLEPDYSMKKSPNVFGANNLTNGQWWPSRVCALRDGAHGEQEAGIYGQTGIGAYSIVVAAGGYDDKDRGDVRIPVYFRRLANQFRKYLTAVQKATHQRPQEVQTYFANRTGIRNQFESSGLSIRIPNTRQRKAFVTMVYMRSLTRRSWIPIRL